MRRNDKGECMVEHHICYEETEGWDETIWMTAGEHHALHHKLREENRCNIPVKEMIKMTQAASKRSDKYKKYSKEYYQENKEEYGKRAKKWHEENPEKVQVKRETWRNKNPNYNKEYTAKNKEKRKKYYKEWYARKKMERKNNEL